jgi:hypothetical protein
VIQGTTTLYKVARLKQLFARGQGWLYIGKDMIMLFIGIFVFGEVLKKWGVPIQPWFIYLYPVLPFAFVVMCVLVGWFDEQWGIWKEESRYSINHKINPIGDQMYKWLKELHDDMVKRQEGK